MSWADRKALVRRTVHTAFGVTCLYREGTGVVTTLSARLHTRSVSGGNQGIGGGYATIVENTPSIVFDKEELAIKGVVPKRNAMVTFPDYGSNFVLDVADSDTGPIIYKWSLSEK